MGLIDSIKNDVKKSGGNKAKFIYFRENTKIRVRFLQDMDEGMEVTFHDSYDRGINCMCQEHLGKDCPYCEDENVRTRSLYIWSVWNYETSEVQLFMFAVNNCSPIPSLMAMYENYGTLTDRDYVITCNGKGTNKSYSVVPMDKNKFRNEKAKPFAENAVYKLIDKAFPCDKAGSDDDEDESPLPKKSSKVKAKAKPEPEVEEDSDWGEDEGEAVSYEDMSPKELYKLCKERNIDVQPKKPAKYYIQNLEEYDKQNEDWGDEEEDDWEDE